MDRLVRTIEDYTTQLENFITDLPSLSTLETDYPKLYCERFRNDSGEEIMDIGGLPLTSPGILITTPLIPLFIYRDVYKKVPLEMFVAEALRKEIILEYPVNRLSDQEIDDLKFDIFLKLAKADDLNPENATNVCATIEAP